MKTPAKESLSAKRRARVFERTVERHAALSHPWSLGNVRLYQRFFAEALKERSTILKTYLKERKARK